MTFLGPALGTLLAAGATIVGALVALYLLRPSRRRVEVPYARLWGLVVREAKSSAIARRLRRWESLLVQLLVAALLLFAISDPHFGGHGDRPRHVVLVDTSASMAARDSESSEPRIALARRAVHRVLDGLSPDEEAMIVAFDSSPHPLSPLTTDEATLRAAADHLVAAASPDAIIPSLRLAADALAGAGARRLTIVSDGAIDEHGLSASPQSLGLDGVDVRFEAVAPLAEVTADGSATSENLAITGFAVRRYPANPSAYEILVEVRSYSDQPRHARLTISQEGDPVEITELELAPHARVQRLLSDLSGEGQRLEAHLESTHFDALDTDDVAYALLPERHRTKILLVGAGDLYTEGALLLDRGVDVERRTPDNYDPEHAKTADAIVFVGVTPRQPAPRPALFLGCDGADCPFVTRGSVGAPTVTEIARAHPVMKWITLTDLNVTRSATYTLTRGDVALASTLGRALLVAGERNGQRAIALGFAPSTSDLPLRVAFPVLLVNALKWLSGRSLEAVDSALTGHASRLAATSSPLELLAPDGSSVSLPVRDHGTALVATQVGFYRGTRNDAQRIVSANLFDPRESSIGGKKLMLFGKPVPPPARLERVPPRAALWRWLALVAIAALLVEWWTYHRRWTV